MMESNADSKIAPDHVVATSQKSSVGSGGVFLGSTSDYSPTGFNCKCNQDRLQQYFMANPVPEEMSVREQQLLKPEASGVNGVNRRGYGDSSKRSPDSFSRNNQLQSNERNTCRRCGRKQSTHSAQNCPAKDWDCLCCIKRGHTSNVCRQYLQNNISGVNRVKCLAVGASLRKFSPPLLWDVSVDGVMCQFEVDDGSGETLMSLQEFHQKFQQQGVQLEGTGTLSLTTFTDEKVKPCGKFTATVSIDEDCYGEFEVIVVDTGSRFTPLLGRSWLDILNPNWRNLLKP